MAEVGQHQIRWSEDRTQKLLVLHVDDDPFELEKVEKTLKSHAVGCEFVVKSVASATELHKILDSGKKFDLYLLDVHLGPEESAGGIALAKEVREKSPDAVIIMRSSADDVTTIGDCLRAGADDFISKASDKGELCLRLYHSYRLAKHKSGDFAAAPVASDRTGKKVLNSMIGKTMEKIVHRAPLIIDSAISAVFVSGESGTGKEVVATAFENQLPEGTPFIRFNCGAIAPTLLESELFGHVKGAFTGAIVDKRGLFEAASGGWIFLDEVATLTPSAQVALLRVLENQEVMRVGSTQARSIQVRVLSATNEPIADMVKLGKFRADLWQRLREAEIVLPPLRERMAEVEPLTQFFCKTMAGGPYEIAKPAMEILQSYTWHEGNIRELRNTLRAMTETHVGKLLTPLSIPKRIWAALDETPSANGASQTRETPPLQSPKGDTLELSLGSPTSFDFEQLSDGLMIEIIKRLSKTNGKLSLRGLSKTIGISRSTLSDRLRALVNKRRIPIQELAAMVGISETE